MLACDESASIDCARLIRGMASIAKLVTPALAIARMPSALVSGPRKPMSTLSESSRPISSALGAATLTTRSAPRATVASSIICAPASSNAWSGISAPAPASRWTRTWWSWPVSLPTTSGASATRRSPSAVSFGTPIRMRRCSV